MKTKRGRIKTCLIAVVVFVSLLGIVGMAEAQPFWSAFMDDWVSNSYYSNGQYWFDYALYVTMYGYSGQAYDYYAYAYFNNSLWEAYDAFTYAYEGYQANSTSTNYYAYYYSYYYYYYRCYEMLYTYYCYALNNLGYANTAAYFGYQAEWYGAYANYYVGLACKGGTA
jgi:hypothetical protein